MADVYLALGSLREAENEITNVDDSFEAASRIRSEIARRKQAREELERHGRGVDSFPSEKRTPRLDEEAKK